MNTSKRYFTSKEYNTIVLKLTSSSYEYSKNKEEYDLLMDKAYHMLTPDNEEEVLQKEEILEEHKLRSEYINRPLTTKPTISNL